jgi:putative MATE family efflux protein
LGLTFARELLLLINTPRDVFAASLGYLRIVLWTLPLTFWLFLIGAMLRGIGDSRTPVYFQMVSVLLNTVLDPILMFGWLGFPRLGLNGTAWATIFSQAAAVVALMCYVPKRRSLVMPQLRPRRMDLQTTWLLVEIGFPSMVQQSVVSVSMLVIVGLVSRFGSLTDAAFGAGLRIDSIAFMPAMTIGIAASTLAGQNLGARKPERVREVFRWGLLVSGSISLVIAVLAASFPAFFLRIFINDSRVLAIGIGYVHIIAATYVLYAVMFVSHGIINGAGHTLVTTLISMIALWGIRLPLAALLSRHHDEPTGIWYAMLISVCCGMVMSLSVYFSGLWKRPVVKLRLFGNRNQRGEVSSSPPPNHLSSSP